MHQSKVVCQNCSNLMVSETSDTQFRCGYEYFKQPPVNRQAKKMSAYPEVKPSDSCERWVNNIQSALREKFE